MKKIIVIFFVMGMSPLYGMGRTALLALRGIRYYSYSSWPSKLNKQLAQIDDLNKRVTDLERKSKQNEELRKSQQKAVSQQIAEREKLLEIFRNAR